ncbi:MAG: conjugal transfer protein TraG N-terminal domain-containing protein [Ahniella sp.]|nr:conjugal transfer protein TraG N-terminal domain-containing protein [Ahniella sp.]
MLAYLRDCAMRARQFEVLSDHTIAHAPEPLSAIRWNNNLQQTRSWLVSLSGESEAVGCGRAHDLLQQKSGDMLAGLDPAYQERFGSGTGESIGRALASVADRSAQDAQTYMAGALINALWLEASSGSSFGSMGNSNTITLRAALEQRRTQWISEETAFLKAMRPMIGYFEAFFYALSPFIAFLVGLGALGLRMIVKYVSLTLAVALWMPILAITNLYQVTTLQDFFATQQRMAQLAESGIFSLSNNAAVIDQATEAVALASMIAAATPMLTLTLLFGGAVAATSLFSRLQGQDHLNEKISTPDPVGAAPVYQSSPGYVGNDTMGLRRTGAEANAVRFDLGEQLQHSARSMHAQSRAATDAAMQTWSNVLSRNAVFEQVFASALEHQLTDATALSRNEGAQALDRSGVDLQERLHAAESYNQSTAMKGDATAMAGLSIGRLINAAQGQADSMQRSVAGALPSGSTEASAGTGQVPNVNRATTAAPASRGGGGKLADLGVQASASGEVRETGQDTTRMEKGLSDSRSLSTQQQKSVDMMMQHALSEAMKDSLQQASRFGISEQSQRQLARTASDLAQTSEAFEEAEMAAQRFDVGQSISLLAASERISNLPPEQRHDIQMLARSLGGDAAYSRNLQALRSGEMSGAPASAEGQDAAAALYTLAEIGPGVALTEHAPGLAGLANERREALTYALRGESGSRSGSAAVSRTAPRVVQFRHADDWRLAGSGVGWVGRHTVRRHRGSPGSEPFSAGSGREWSE